FTNGFRKPVELADIEIDPAQLVLGRAFGNQDHLGLDDAGIADEAPARFHDGLRYGVAEVPAQRPEYGAAIRFELGGLAHIAGGKPAAEIDHGKVDPALGAAAENRGGRSKRPVPCFNIVLLGTHVEGNAVGHEPASLRKLEDIGRVVRLTAE